MKTREEEIRQMAKSYTQVIYDSLDDFSDITDAYIDGAKWADETMIEKACDWLPIDRDENGFATEECLDKIFNNLPCAVCSQTEGGYKYYNFVNEYLDMWHNREDIRTNTGYTHYLPIPKLEV